MAGRSHLIQGPNFIHQLTVGVTSLLQAGKAFAQHVEEEEEKFILSIDQN